ncbi:glycoside hydrolase family 128 protein, partial [Plicaturopsis crispa FD-325 SS-3]
YTWAPEIPSEAKKLGLEGVPMLWGARQIDDFKKTVVKGYANWVLGMNEPNESGQSNMSPEDGAKMWQQYIQPLKNQGYKLISPATSSNPNGLTWVKNFMKACDGCTFDAVAVHWYGVKAQDFIDYVNLWHTTFNKNIWVTEFACQNFDGGAQANEGQIFDFMKTALNFLEGASFVDQYFAFGIMHDMQNVNALNQLMAGNNKPTALGSLYLSGKK